MKKIPVFDPPGKHICFIVLGVAVMLFAGFVYAWSILSAPIAADFPAWSNAALSMTFTLCMACFCLGGFAAGLLSKHLSPRVNLIVAGILFLAGFPLASRAGGLGMLYLSFGVLCGAASGFAYNAVMSIVPKWFPTRQGLVSGLLLMGFGSGSLIIGSVFAALTFEMLSWRQFFLGMGPLTALILLSGALMLKTVPAAASAAANGPEQPAQDILSGGFTPMQMLCTSSFWFFFLWAVLLGGAGLSLISQSRLVAAVIGNGFSSGTIAVLVGMISVCNGLGRVVVGGFFDRHGRKRAMLLVTLGFLICPLLLMASLWTGSAVLLTAGFLTAGLSYGGVPTLCASFTRSAFGERSYSVNFSLVNLNLLLASFGGTIAGALYDSSHTLMSVFFLIFLCAAAALLCMLGMERGRFSLFTKRRYNIEKP